MPDRYLPLIEEMLEHAITDEKIPRTLRESMAYSLLSGGKRLRPRICMACCDMLGGDITQALPVACGLEMIHAYSLIHDDLPCMDNDDYRRGKPSNHKIYGEAGATLAGDALLSFAFEWMLSHTPDETGRLKNYISAVQAVAAGAGAAGMVAGQSLELSGALENGSANIEKIQMLKTGALIRAAALAGGQVARADKKKMHVLEEFAVHYGALFQITDDLIDFDHERDDEKNYAAVYGLTKAHEAAYVHADESRKALLHFGENAAYLTDLVGKTLSRAV